MTTARDYAEQLVRATTLEGKLVPPPADLALEDTGPPLRIAAPGRPASLAIVPVKRGIVPPVAGMHDPAQRARILHALANHELQAIELFAWALLAYPDAPLRSAAASSRSLPTNSATSPSTPIASRAFGTSFGDHPVTGHFWNKLDHLASPLHFVCAMGLTFENANLDFANDYAVAARACGDTKTAAALDQVHTDEIAHVHFAYAWLRRLAPDTDPWTAYLAHVRPPLGPRRARGPRFDADARRRAGFSPEFILKLGTVLT